MKRILFGLIFLVATAVGIVATEDVPELFVLGVPEVTYTNKHLEVVCILTNVWGNTEFHHNTNWVDSGWVSYTGSQYLAYCVTLKQVCKNIAQSDVAAYSNLVSDAGVRFSVTNGFENVVNGWGFR